MEMSIDKFHVYDNNWGVIAVFKDFDVARKFRNKLDRRYAEWFGCGKAGNIIPSNRSKKYYANGDKKTNPKTP